MKSFINQPLLPRGLRNNNPGNLRRGSSAWQGKIPFAQSQDTAFEQFTYIEFGLRAMMKLLQNYQKNNDLHTIEQIVTKYAPSSENNTYQYIASVTNEMRLKKDAVLDLTTDLHLIGLAKAMVKVEIGQGYENYITQQMYYTAFNMLEEVKTATPNNTNVNHENMIEPTQPATTKGKFADYIKRNKINILTIGISAIIISFFFFSEKKQSVTTNKKRNYV